MVAASAILYVKHARHPFGDGKAIAWWIGLLALDALVAALLATGTFALVSLEVLEDVDGLIRGAAVGLLGPLAFRSPVRQVTVARVRIYLDRALDERLTRLRRRDRNGLRTEVEAQGWDDVALRGRIEDHIDDLKSLTQAERARIRKSVRAAMTLPGSRRVRALLKVCLDERFSALIDDLKSSPPSEDDRRRGREAKKKDAL